MTSKHSDEEGAGETRPASLTTLTARNVGVWLVLALILGVLLGVFLAHKFPGPTPAPPPQANATTDAYHAGEMEVRAKAVDTALLRAVRTIRPGAERLRVQSVETKRHAGAEYHLQIIALPLEQDVREEFARVLARELAASAPNARLSRPSPERWDIALDGVATHRLVLTPEAEAPGKPPAPSAKGRLALVIDDMGEDVGFAQGLAALDAPVAFSVWPDSGQREAVLKIARTRGREILIHLPMQPQGYPGVDPGRHPLLLSMTAEQVQAAVRRAVERVPGAIGVNNHMGSQFTENPFGMHAALAAIKEQGLFFLDSRTSAATVGERESRRVGVRFHKRDVFLDNEPKVAAILLQLRKAEVLARSRGHAIAIGHPHPETLAAIRQWLRDKDDAVQVVPLSSLGVR